MGLRPCRGAFGERRPTIFLHSYGSRHSMLKKVAPSLIPRYSGGALVYKHSILKPLQTRKNRAIWHSRNKAIPFPLCLEA